MEIKEIVKYPYVRCSTTMYLPGTVLSRTKPIKPPTNIAVLSNTVNTRSTSSFPGEPKCRRKKQFISSEYNEVHWKCMPLIYLCCMCTTFISSLQQKVANGKTIKHFVHVGFEENNSKIGSKNDLFIFGWDLNPVYVPVLMTSGSAFRYFGNIKPINIEVPMISRFLLDLSETNCRLDSPTDVTIPKLMRIMPPRTGLGKRVNTAPNFPQRPQAIKINPAAWNALLLATCNIMD